MVYESTGCPVRKRNRCRIARCQVAFLEENKVSGKTLNFLAANLRMKVKEERRNCNWEQEEDVDEHMAEVSDKVQIRKQVFDMKAELQKIREKVTNCEKDCDKEITAIRCKGQMLEDKMEGVINAVETVFTRIGEGMRGMQTDNVKTQEVVENVQSEQTQMKEEIRRCLALQGCIKACDEVVGKLIENLGELEESFTQLHSERTEQKAVEEATAKSVGEIADELRKAQMKFSIAERVHRDIRKGWQQEFAVLHEKVVSQQDAVDQLVRCDELDEKVRELTVKEISAIKSKEEVLDDKMRELTAVVETVMQKGWKQIGEGMVGLQSEHTQMKEDIQSCLKLQEKSVQMWDQMAAAVQQKMEVLPVIQDGERMLPRKKMKGGR